MNILEQINNDVVVAMKNGDKSLLSTLRMAKNALQMEKIKLNHDLSNEEIITTLKRQVKQKEDSIVEYSKYNKMDTVDDLKKEIVIIKAYLPEELSIDEINKGLDEIFLTVKPTGMKDMKILMSEADKLFGVRADKKTLSELIRSRLN
jgi:uncharacterized protein YqeY